MDIVRGVINSVDWTHRTVILVRSGDNAIISCNFPVVVSLDINANKMYFNKGDQLSVIGKQNSPTSFTVKDVIGIELPTNIDSFKYFIISNMNKLLNLFHVSQIYAHLEDVANTTGNNCAEDQMSIFADMWSNNQTSILYEDFLTMTYNDGDGRISRVFKADAFGRMMSCWIKFYDLRKLQAMGLSVEEIEKSGYSSYQLRKQLMINPYLVASITFQRCQLCDMYIGRIPLDTDKPCHSIKRRLWLDVIKKKWSCTPHANLLRVCGNLNNYLDPLQNIYEVVIDEVPLYKQDDTIDDVKPIIGYTKMYYLKKQYDVVMLIKNRIIKRMTDEPYHKLGQPLITNHLLDEFQRDGIYQAMNSNVSIITGPAGSGKTTLLKELCHNLEMHNVKYAVASFTGKAVVRARQMSGLGERCATLHRMLGGNADNCDFKYLIMDEATMTSNELMYEFEKVYGHDFPILFVGDVNQLQPIDWGGFFSSMVESRSIPITYLTNIHRVVTDEGYEDGIIKNSTAISNWPDGQLYTFKQTQNFITYECSLIEITSLIEMYKETGVPQSDVTVLCPYAKNYGVSHLNQLIQTIWCGQNDYIEEKDMIWFVGGRVMMLKNNYDIDVFNGQEGLITSVCKDYVEVNFPFVQEVTKKIPSKGCVITQTGAKMVDDIEMISFQRLVKFPFKYSPVAVTNDKDKDSDTKLHISCIQLSYVISVHKSQGSEWSHVIYYIPKEANMDGGFITRDKTYVAITRASKVVIIAGSPYNAVKSIASRPPYRCEMLTNYFKHDLPRLYNLIKREMKFDHDNLITAEECGLDYLMDDDDDY